ncbi:alpha/beta fold hydrolase [Cryobacterium sp. PH31-AA6]|uniref:alpha/beta fold hydrolase n=1 Tax=Cryobacterium sp. PH31-AA6 TaxID=3046205 RepID=UPI0024B8825A|nr:alpha/beta fold hydrolase [Cryobacterium sp. PH31-AA6]MDJ0324412.1 alpha/beta fold hydrolase [Cryobacterium sp. PH31-AA6]
MEAAPAPVLDAFARRLDGVRIAYDWVPGDRPILLVHGFASTARVSWTGTGWVRFLEQAGRGVLLPDLRGHGRSDKPHRAADYAPRQLAADLVVVLDTLGLDQVDVVAYSMGSRVAAALAVLAPDRVGRLVLGGAGPVELFESWDRETMTRLLGGESPPDPMIAAVIAAAVGGGGDRAALLACVEGFSGAALDVPAGIPVLYVAGGADPIPAGVAELARARGSAYRELPGRDHLNALASREFMQAALEFLA